MEIGRETDVAVAQTTKYSRATSEQKKILSRKTKNLLISSEAILKWNG